MILERLNSAERKIQTIAWNNQEIYKMFKYVTSTDSM